MKLRFYGAAREVTGSCHCIEINGKKILIDCGMQQGHDERPGQHFPFHVGDIDCVLLTHAHIDHSGRLPLLVKQGFSGKIYTTVATARLVSIMLRDSGHIQEMEAEWRSRKGKGRKIKGDPQEPLYTAEDAAKVDKYIVGCSYGQMIELADGVKFRFTDAGHLLGSSFIELWATEKGVTKKIVFSGDIGNIGQPIIRDPQYVGEADFAVMESTYGDRNHEPSEDYTADLARIIHDTMSAGGNVIIPSFAIGRTQELLYFIRDMKERGLVKCCPNFPVYVDSPLATEATKIYDGDLEGYIDKETLAVIKRGADPLSFSNLYLIEAVEESKALNSDQKPKVIISSSGMCEAGRIRHHLRHNITRAECSLVFVGYQAEGTLGRMLLDGVKTVKLFGEELGVRCSIHNFRGLSAHADKDGLMKWAKAFNPKPEMIFVVHGESDVCDVFVKSLAAEGITAWAPKYTAEYDLIENECTYQGMEQAGEEHIPTAPSSEYEQLVAVGNRLLEAIRHNRGGANRDLKRFATEIDALAKKWER